ncbi:MAG: lamin tail domain-containing protein, partial [Candidatus Marinimicrobia bacterium]|nr:lamin tail domain-containing protein [Candidatus Neomarinimicrobiota bacterium]
MKAISLVFINIQVLFSQNLFFSEYVEGSSNNKYLEIFNGGSESISLADFQLINCSNGCTSWERTHSFTENTNLVTHAVWVVCSTGSDPAILSECDQTIANNSIFNGDDAWALQQISTNNILDIIGVIGDDPGSGWEVAGISNATKDHTLIRKEGVESGVGENWSEAAGTNTDDSQWTVKDKDDFSGIGSHVCSACSDSVSVCNNTTA